MTSTGLFNFHIPKPGDRIGDNTVIAPIAEGGMARIYKVKNEVLEVIRVVKLLKPSPDFDSERFVTEARISANLNHPNIIQCYRFDKYEDAIPYIEMEYVDGINLHRLISINGRLPIPVVISIVYYLCQALYALHTCSYTLYDVKRSGIVHRDIKPSNIVISKEGNVKLADFGIAKPRDLSIHTSEVEVVGSVYYLSPEQLRKEALDFRTDIYSLGCVTYEMVTAVKAFEHTNIPDIAQAKIKNFYSRKLLDNCPKNLKHIITKCIKADRKERFEKIESVSTEIELLLKDYTIQNPQEVIQDFIKDPKNFISPHLELKKRSKLPRVSALASIIVILFIIGLFSTISLLKRKEFFKKDISNITSERLKPVEDKTSISSNVTFAPEISKENNNIPQSTQLPKKTAPKPLKKQASNKLITPEKDFAEAAYSAFKRNDYNKCIRLLSKKSNISDQLFLCYLGSLAETKNFSRLSKLINSRSVNDDGYYHYIKGRSSYNNKDFDSAIAHFLKAMVVNSFYTKLSYYSYYYLSKSKSAKYLKTPSIVNKNIMVKSLERFISNYCDNPSSAECKDITVLLDKHK